MKKIKNITRTMASALVLAWASMSSSGLSAASPVISGVAEVGGQWCQIDFPAEKNLNASQITTNFSSDDLLPLGGIVYADGLLYVNYPVYGPYGEVSENTQYVFNPKMKKQVEERKLSPEAVCHAMAYDRRTDVVYCYWEDGYHMEYEYYAFGKMNQADGAITQINTIGVPWRDQMIAMTFANDGKLYGINCHGQLETIATSNGEHRIVGQTGIIPGGAMHSMCTDPVSGRVFWSCVTEDNKSGLYEVNLDTGRATLITALPNNINVCGIYISDPEVPANAPAVVTDITSTFDGPAITNGAISFKAPAVTKGGSALSGTLKATVIVDGNVYTTQVAPGATGTVTGVKVSVPEIEKLLVFTEAEDVSSDRASVFRWIGPDKPVAPTNVILKDNGKNLLLSWTAPTEGIHGGYVNVDDIVYTVAANGGGLFVQDIKDTFLEIEKTDKRVVSYGVMPVYVNSVKDQVGTTAWSNEINIGSDVITVPHYFSYGNSFDECTIIDANKDGNTFTETYFNGIEFKTPRGVTADDWVITPPFALEADTEYVLTLDSRVPKFMTTEKVEMFIGKGKTVEDMTQSIGKADITKTGNSEVNEFTFKTDASGNFNIGLHIYGSSGSEITFSGFDIKAKKKEITGKIYLNGTVVDNEDKHNETTCFVGPDENGIFILKGVEMEEGGMYDNVDFNIVFIDNDGNETYYGSEDPEEEIELGVATPLEEDAEYYKFMLEDGPGVYDFTVDYYKKTVTVTRGTPGGLYLIGTVEDNANTANAATLFTGPDADGNYTIKGVKLNENSAYGTAGVSFLMIKGAEQTWYGAEEVQDEAPSGENISLTKGSKTQFDVVDGAGVYDITVNISKLHFTLTLIEKEETPNLYAVGAFNNWNYADPYIFKYSGYAGTYTTDWREPIAIDDTGFQLSTAKGSKEEFESAAICTADGSAISSHSGDVAMKKGASVMYVEWPGDWEFIVLKDLSVLQGWTDTPRPDKAINPKKINPLPGKYPSLKDFTLTFEFDIEEISTVEGMATLTSGNRVINLAARKDGNNLILSIPEEITEAGVYELVIKEGLVKMVSGNINAERDWKYLVTDKAPMDVYVYGDIPGYIYEDKAPAGKMTSSAPGIYEIKGLPLTGDLNGGAHGYGNFMFKLYNQATGELEDELNARHYTSTDEGTEIIDMDVPTKVYYNGMAKFCVYIFDTQYFDILLDLNNLTVTVTKGSSKVEEIEIDSESGECYDLNGLRVKNPERGIYIKNGKKVMVINR